MKQNLPWNGYMCIKVCICVCIYVYINEKVLLHTCNKARKL